MLSNPDYIKPMEPWVIITICAAFFQTLRTALQKNLKLNLSTNAVSFVRFFYGLPWAIFYIIILITVLNLPLPKFEINFWLFCTIAAVAQIIATSLLIYLFSFKNFIIGTTYIKTEAIQAAIFALIFFNEKISLLGVIAISFGIFGIMLISVAQKSIKLKSLLKGIVKKEALIGLLSGGCFAIASVCLREASLSLESDSFMLQAAMTLVCTLLIQTILMSTYITIKEREQWKPIFTQWRKTGTVGLTSVLGSGCWFTAFTLASASYVKTVGQIEIVFTLIMSIFIFKEKIEKHEVFGIIFILASILLLIYS